MTRPPKSLLAKEDGAMMVEYALKLALIAALMIAVVGALSSALNTKLAAVATSIG